MEQPKYVVARVQASDFVHIRIIGSIWLLASDRKAWILNTAPLEYQEAVRLHGTPDHDGRIYPVDIILSTPVLLTLIPCLTDTPVMLGSFQLDLLPRSLPHTTITSCLHDGAIFKGSQTSKGKEYDVEVTIQFVQLAKKWLCGYLKMDNLTRANASLTTYFEGEIISRLYPFITGKWDASIETDISHWKRIANNDWFDDFQEDNFDYSQLEKSDTIYMRWKERFLLPDPKIKEIDGASYAGFYYIGLKTSTGEITGFYYHFDSEKFQNLKLKYVPEDIPSVFHLR